MNNKTTQTAVPKLRFPEFRDAGGWQVKSLQKLAKRMTLKNKDDDIKRVLTNSAIDGVVDQRDYFDKDIANKNNLNGYCIVDEGDYVYNPRISNVAPVGPISKNRIGKGIMSPLYTVFRFNCSSNEFYEQYFKSTQWHHYLKKISNSGARHDRISITNDEFMKMPLPEPESEEQQKIADCLSSVDELIAHEGQKLEALQDHKKGLMQELFPAEGETLPKRRFPEFQNAPEWEEKEVGEIFKVTRGNVLSMTLVGNQQTDAKPYPVYSSQTKRNGLSGFYSEYLYGNAITWTTDGANAGDVNYRSGKFYCTNVCGVLLNDEGYANPCIAALINNVSKNHVSYVGNPKLMNGVMSKIRIPVPAIAEQKKIIELLSSLDEIVDNQLQKIEALKEHKTGLMQQLFPSAEEVMG